MTEFHMPPAQVDELHRVLKSLPYAGATTLKVSDVVGAGSLLKWLLEYQSIMAQLDQLAEENKFELELHRKLVDNQRWLQRVLNQQPGEDLCTP